jgi:hypothetical protein
LEAVVPVARPGSNRPDQRLGQPAWVKAIEATKRKTLLIAGTLTNVCMSFPKLSAVVARYKVFTIVYGSGN